MFVALYKKIKNPVGKTIVAKHMDKSDSQAVIKDLVAHFSANGPGSIEMTHEEDRLHALVFTTDAAQYLKDRKSGGTLTETIEQWCRNLLAYDEITGTVTAPERKKKAFQKFIRPLKQLRHVTDQEESTSALIGSVASNTLFTPEMVIKLYKQAATRSIVPLSPAELESQTR
jgi:hypothetical protein